MFLVSDDIISKTVKCLCKIFNLKLEFLKRKMVFFYKTISLGHRVPSQAK